MGKNEANITNIQGCNVPFGCQVFSALKTASPKVAKIGDTIKYTIELKNDMNYTVEDIVLKDTIPQGMELIAGTLKVNGITSSGDLSVGIPINQIQPKNNATITFSVKITSASINPKINTARISYIEVVEGVQVPGEITTNASVVDVVGVIIDKKFEPSKAVKGDIVTVSIHVNSIADSSKNIITDELPPELQLIDDKINVSGEVISGNITQGIDIGPIAKGQTKVVSFKVKVI